MLMEIGFQWKLNLRGCIMWPENMRKLKRGPAVVLPKDFGLIAAYAGIGRESVVIDAGSGSGWLAVQLGRIAKKISSYETRPDFASLASENAKRAGLGNVSVKLRDVIRDGFEEKGEADLVCLDMADSDKALVHAAAALKDGGAVVGYLPHAEQLKAFVLAGKAAGFGDWYCIEGIVREMLVREAGVRPANMGLMHTGYLAFGRKGAPNLEESAARKKRRR
jgi:tRNA (adenine57-N1/adenine58-N1)-methyltransferase